MMRPVTLEEFEVSLRIRVALLPQWLRRDLAGKDAATRRFAEAEAARLIIERLRPTRWELQAPDIAWPTASHHLTKRD